MKEIQEKNNAELKNYVTDKREELRSARFSATGSGVRKTSSIKQVRKEIARTLTEINKRAKEEADNNA